MREVIEWIEVTERLPDDDTGEFAQCFCGKTNLRDELALASPPAAEEKT